MSRPVFAVIGSPLQHSLSPRLFTWLFARLGIDAAYEAVEVAPSGLADAVAALRAGRWAGLSVTLPHKLHIGAHLDGALPQVRAAGGAINCVLQQEGRWLGSNTDVAGVVDAIRRAAPGRRFEAGLVLGAGGAAHAAVSALHTLGIDDVWVANRTAAKALELASHFGRVVQGTALDGRLPLERFDLVVQATSVGLGDAEATPLPAGLHVARGAVAFDAVYRPLRSRFLREAEAHGAQSVDGLWMLIDQACAALTHWTGRTVEEPLRLALHDALAKEAA